ncbi:insertase [Devosia limi DSM 17137]|uniref:Membrane protein insertase YidC n=1 Tax=Devosia limi DSM 17137 TaxID=1121477 RepID=A0A0F5L3L7_9HYPH|nr:membrane protein insertase YidC [Devosia limi]KKB76794.1 insertase [Devosia limi DSM 17137]SHF29365.1 protein translocase subunit yidC [Devosia limi DSM 17137]
MTDNRNVIIAIVLSMLVLFGWQFLVAGPQLERAQQQAVIAQQQAEAEASLAIPTTGPDGAPIAASGAVTFPDRAAAIAASPRIPIDTADLAGSINLTGARIDDLELKMYRETVDPNSPIITLLTPAGVPNAYFVEQGWTPAAGTAVAVPDSQSVWTVEGDTATLTAETPITLVYDNGQGQIFRRTFAVDDRYLFTVTQSVENQGAAEVALYPYARVVRHGTPKVANFFIQHEGPLGVLGSNNLISKKYTDLHNEPLLRFDNTSGWLGFTDKYWATAVLAEPTAGINAQFSWKNTNGLDDYQTSFVDTTPVVVAPGATASHESFVFAGAKEEAVISSYERDYNFDRLSLLIDWGWLHFITKPMFHLLTFLYGVLGNFGLAILAVTVIVKAIFFPLASRSYASMAAMRRVQPEMKSIQERFKEDRPAQQQAMMELYKREKINPLSGCWPILIQIPVFFSLYTVIFISLEMRHAPFFGWIQDLAAPDPTNIFTLFGLIPWDPTVMPVIGGFLHLGVWPVIMGITMWVQMKLNPPPPDPTQAMIFNWMPVIFTFMLGTFPAGLVIYWAWNNTLSVTQQWFIMKRHGAEVNLFGNIMDSFKRKPKPAETPKA